MGEKELPKGITDLRKKLADFSSLNLDSNSEDIIFFFNTGHSTNLLNKSLPDIVRQQVGQWVSTIDGYRKMGFFDQNTKSEFAGYLRTIFQNFEINLDDPINKDIKSVLSNLES